MSDALRDRLVDRIARARYERYDSHYSTADGMSWAEYKADDPDGAYGVYVSDAEADIEEADDALTDLLDEAETLAWQRGYDCAFVNAIGQVEQTLGAMRQATESEDWAADQPTAPLGAPPGPPQAADALVKGHDGAADPAPMPTWGRNGPTGFTLGDGLRWAAERLKRGGQ